MIKKAKDSNNYILSVNPLPTYVFENINLLHENDRLLEKKMEKAYERAYGLVDEANEELRDYANDRAAEFENKRNSADLDLARDLFTIYIKDGYNYGFSMILEFDDLFIDGISREQRTNLKNSIQSYAVALMKDIANKVGMTQYGTKATDYKKAIDEKSVESLKLDVKYFDDRIKTAIKDNDDKTYYELMNQRNNLVRKIMKLERSTPNKGHDSADLQIQIRITEELAQVLIKNVTCNNEKVTFTLEGSDFNIIYSDPIHFYFADYDPYDFDSDDFYKRIQEDGDLHVEAIDELVGEEATLLIWL